jgi:hypothetical protein
MVCHSLKGSHQLSWPNSQLPCPQSRYLHLNTGASRERERDGGAHLTNEVDMSPGRAHHVWRKDVESNDSSKGVLQRRMKRDPRGDGKADVPPKNRDRCMFRGKYQASELDTMTLSPF